MDFLTETKIPVGKVAKAFVDWLTTNLAWFFDALAAIMEALIGACFVEHGFDRARTMVRKLWAEEVDGKAGKRKHPKSALQEWTVGNKRRMPEYSLVERSGPDHNLRFTVRVEVHGIGEASATASSKQDAETLAAELFMRKFA